MGLFKDYLNKSKQISQNAKERTKDKYRNSDNRYSRQMQEEFDQQDAADEFGKKVAMAVGKGLLNGGVKLTKSLFNKTHHEK